MILFNIQTVMKTPRYICSKCQQPFTRRWNAYRHSNTKHYGEIENIISFTEYIITNQKDSSIPSNAYSEVNNFSHQPKVKDQIFLTSQFFQIICDPVFSQIHLMMPQNVNYSPMNFWLNQVRNIKKCDIFLSLQMNHLKATTW